MTNILSTVDIARTLRAALLGTAFAVAAVVTGSHVATAQSAPIIYPSQGQSIDQQANDEAACRSWSQQQTGFNPAQGPVNYGSSGSGGGEVIRGAAALGPISRSSRSSSLMTREISNLSKSPPTRALSSAIESALME